MLCTLMVICVICVQEDTSSVLVGFTESYNKVLCTWKKKTLLLYYYFDFLAKLVSATCSLGRHQGHRRTRCVSKDLASCS